MSKLIFAFHLIILTTTCPAADLRDANVIVSKSDEVRNPQIDYTVQVRVTSFKKGREVRRAEYEVMVKGKDRTLIKTMAPANERGQTTLMVGRDLWTFLPDASQPIRVSLQQRLIGEVAIGDIARANFSGDYHARLIKGEKDDYFLELKAVSEEVTYAKIVYAVSKKDFHPQRAAFYAASGKLLKKCTYENYKTMAGRLRPSRLVMVDPVVAGQKSVVEYDDMIEAELPAKNFTKDYLKKLKY
jgi:outer membrane lipoprotein-sorting protein